MLGGALSLGTASLGGRVAWVVPTYKNGNPLWRWCEQVSWPLVKSGAVNMNKSERTIVFDNGGFLGIYSADNENSIRGERFDLAVLDEAARIPETAWMDAIQPTLADLDGNAILISTPIGMNWFHTEWARGRDRMDADMASWTAPTSDNPSPQIKKAAEKAKSIYGENSRTYRQEWMAEFIADGAFFRNIDNAAVIEAQDNPELHAHDGHFVVAGVDLAKHEDFTVVTIACRECNRVIAWDRFNQMNYTYQIERIKSLFKQYDVDYALFDATGVGDPVVEMMQNALAL